MTPPGKLKSRNNNVSDTLLNADEAHNPLPVSPPTLETSRITFSVYDSCSSDSGEERGIIDLASHQQPSLNKIPKAGEETRHKPVECTDDGTKNEIVKNETVKNEIIAGNDDLGVGIGAKESETVKKMMVEKDCDEDIKAESARFVHTITPLHKRMRFAVGDALHRKKTEIKDIFGLTGTAGDRFGFATEVQDANRLVSNDFEIKSKHMVNKNDNSAGNEEKLVHSELLMKPSLKRVRFADDGALGNVSSSSGDETGEITITLGKEFGVETGIEVNGDPGAGKTELNNKETASEKEDNEDVEAELARFERMVADANPVEADDEDLADLEERREENIQSELLTRVVQLREQAATKINIVTPKEPSDARVPGTDKHFDDATDDNDIDGKVDLMRDWLGLRG